MTGRYIPLLATTALMTAAATVAQPQTTTGSSTDGSSTTGSSAVTTATGVDTTTSTTDTAASSADRDQSNTTGTSTTTGTRDTSTGDGLGTTGPMSTPQTNPSGTTTGTATDSSTGTEGMHGTYRGTSQDATGTGTGTSATSTDNDAATTGASAAAGASTGAAGANALQGQDAEFLRQAMESDRMEIASAQAALANAQRSDTKTAAQMLLRDHQQSSQKLQQLVSRKGWSMPAGISSAESDQARMTSAGAGFDDRFMAEQVRMHRDAISLFRQQVANGSDPDLRQFAREQLPHLEHHLEMLQGSNTQK
jgi:putative membrane protein